MNLKIFKINLFCILSWGKYQKIHAVVHSIKRESLTPLMADWPYRTSRNKNRVLHMSARLSFLRCGYGKRRYVSSCPLSARL